MKGFDCKNVACCKYTCFVLQILSSVNTFKQQFFISSSHYALKNGHSFIQGTNSPQANACARILDCPPQPNLIWIASSIPSVPQANLNFHYSPQANMSLTMHSPPIRKYMYQTKIQNFKDRQGLIEQIKSKCNKTCKDRFNITVFLIKMYISM